MWRYRFEPRGDSRTRVTEGYEVRWIPMWARILDVPTNRHKELLKGMRTTLERLKTVFADTIYGYKQTVVCVWIIYRFVLEIVKRPTGKFKLVAKRWVVERTFAWLGRNRRFSKDYERSPRVSETWIYLGMTKLMLRRLVAA